MQIDERTRHEMCERHEEVLGALAADAVMAHLPPSGWADVATKADLEHLEQRIELELEAEVANLRAALGDKIDSLHRTLIAALVAAVVAMGGVALAAGHIAG